MLATALTLTVLPSIVAIAVALLLGTLFYYVSQRSSPGKQERDPEPGDDGDGRSPCAPQLLVELNRMTLSPEQRQQITQSVQVAWDTHVTSIKQASATQMRQLLAERQQSEDRLRLARQEIASEAQRSIAILESVSEGLVVVNAQHEIIMMNPAAERMLGMEGRSAVGQLLYDVLGDEQLLSMHQSSQDDGQCIKLTVHKDSTRMILRASNALVRTEQGKTIGMVSTLSDVFMRRELDTVKSNFVSNITHEFRTPLVVMQHALDVILGGTTDMLNADQRKFLDIAQRNLQRMTLLVDDILDLSKLEARQIDVDLEKASLRGPVTAAIESIKTVATSNAVTVEEEVGGLPDVLIDVTRIKQVLSNLLDNAVKFTLKGGRIIVRAKQISDTQVEVQVTDNGIGIAQDDIPKLFQKFQQGHNQSLIDVHGTGLGLANCREIIELHHGRIWVESNEGQETTFSFTLPIAGELKELHMGEKISILLVDDEPDFIETLAFWMESKGYDIRRAMNGEDAIASVKASVPDMIFLDIQMPKMDGLEALEAIRKIDKDVPVVMLTAAYKSEENFKKANALGASGFFPKQSSLQELGQTIDITLRTRLKRKPKDGD
jgi:PAS domain S-box-containing protein